MKLDLAKAGGIVKSKPRLGAAHSDTALTVFANGHHRPCHRLNNTAHTSGTPYKIPPKSHTLQSHSNGHAKSQHMALNGAADLVYGQEMGRRSVDNLPFAPAGDAELGRYYPAPQRSVDNLPATMMSPEPSFNMQHLLYNNQPHLEDGMHSSVHGSPVEAMSCGGQVPLAQWPSVEYVGVPMESMGSPIPTGSPIHYATPEPEWSVPPNAGFDPTWSASDLPLGSTQLNDFRPISHSGESNPHSVPGLTSSPGMGSEAGDPTSFGEYESLTATSLPLDPPAYDPFKPANRFSAGMLPEYSRPPTSSPDMSSNRRSLDVNLLKRPEGEMNYFLDNQIPPKEIPRTEPVAYTTCASPDMSSLQAMATQPAFASMGYDTDRNVLNPADYPQEQYSSPAPQYLPMDRMDEPALGYPVNTTWA
jgi:hypothetical protein